jgi:Ca2+-binding RTX toxin-like protein
MVNVEVIKLHGNFSYKFITTDATLGNGAILTIDNQTTGATNKLVFNGGAETDGAFTINGGAGNDKIIGCANTDALNGNGGNDVIDTNGGFDHVTGGEGDDEIHLGTLTAFHSIDGGTGNDKLFLNGDFDFTLNNTVIGVETYVFAAGHTYGLGLDAAAGTASMTFDGSKLHSDDRLLVDASHLTSSSIRFKGGAGEDAYWGGGGVDTVAGGDGFDHFFMGANLTAADQIDGGAGSDTLFLSGDYSAGLIMNSTTIRGIEFISLASGGHTYVITTADGNIASGKTLDVSLGEGALTFNGAAETNGKFTFNMNGGTYDLTGGKQADIFNLSAFGTARGGLGDDKFNLTTSLTSTYKLDGGSGNDTVNLTTSSGALVTFTSTTMLGIEKVILADGSNYNFKTASATVATGASMTFDASALQATNTFTFDGSAETNAQYVLIGGRGNDVLKGGSGADIITGGGGADQITAGAGNDTLVFSSVSQSSSTIRDTVTGFDFNNADKLDFNFAITGIDASMSGSVSAATFDADLHALITPAKLGVQHAMLFIATGGDLIGHTFLIVNGNANAGYQGGGDFSIDLVSSANLGSLDTTDFI